MTAIFRRELQGYFHTAVGYVFVGVFLTMSGVLFALNNLIPRSGDIPTLIGQMSYLWMLLCPVLTMRLMPGTGDQGTEKLLLSSPVSLMGILAGKYLAALLVLLQTVLLTLIFPGIVAIYGTVYPEELLVGYVGLTLEGSAFLAMDLFVASLCRGPVLAYLAAFFVNFSAWLLDLWALSVNGRLAGILDFVSLYTRNEPFLMGQLSVASMFFDVSFAVFFLLLTLYRLDLKRRRGI